MDANAMRLRRRLCPTVRFSDIAVRSQFFFSRLFDRRGVQNPCPISGKTNFVSDFVKIVEKSPEKKMSQSPVSRKWTIMIERRMDRPKAVVGGHQGSSANRRYQLSFVGRLWHLWSPLPQGNRQLLNISVRFRAGPG